MSDSLSTLKDSETRLWTHGPEAYRELCSPIVVMAFPGPAGILRGRDAVLAEMEGQALWESAELRDARVDEAGDAAVLSYRAHAKRGGEAVEPYECNCVSTWIKDGDGWQQVSHVQTPIVEG